MKQNKYDDDVFFNKYSNMNRSKNGLEGAGEWHELKKMMPNFKDKRVLDLGCGFGWHCRYAVENGARSVIGIDISQKMLSEAKSKTKYGNIEYICMPIEDIDFPEESFDVVISSLALHYVKSFEDVLVRVYKCLSKGGDFVFSVEHPIFTAQGPQDWYYDIIVNSMYFILPPQICIVIISHPDTGTKLLQVFLAPVSEFDIDRCSPVFKSFSYFILKISLI
jgi:ubiquinone/menaquinone biosynthesis C-methylase UbiE